MAERALVLKARADTRPLAPEILFVQPWTGLLRPETQRGQKRQRSTPGAEATPGNGRVPHPDRRPHQPGSGPGRTLGNDTAIQRDRLTSRHRFFGQVTYRTHHRKAYPRRHLTREAPERYRSLRLWCRRSRARRAGAERPAPRDPRLGYPGRAATCSTGTGLIHRSVATTAGNRPITGQFSWCREGVEGCFPALGGVLHCPCSSLPADVPGGSG